MSLSPFAWYPLMGALVVMYAVTAMMHWNGHITERTAAAAYLACTLGVIALTTVVSSSWWILAPSVTAAAVLAWLLASTWKNTP